MVPGTKHTRHKKYKMEGIYLMLGYVYVIYFFELSQLITIINHIGLKRRDLK